MIQKKKKVTVVNIGDSRCILGHYSTKDIQVITKDHKPTDPAEESRITAAGGVVCRGRVDACLAVSRAIGDRGYKVNADLPPDKQKIVCVPDIFDLSLGADDFLLICCDGLFENFSSEYVMEYIHDRLSENKDTAAILSTLLDEVLAAGSQDNMSAMIVEFKDGVDFEREDEFVPGKWYERGNSTFEKGYRELADKFGGLEKAKEMWLERSAKIIAEKKAKGTWKPEENSENDNSERKLEKSETYFVKINEEATDKSTEEKVKKKGFFEKKKEKFFGTKSKSTSISTSLDSSTSATDDFKPRKKPQRSKTLSPSVKGKSLQEEKSSSVQQIKESKKPKNSNN